MFCLILQALISALIVHKGLILANAISNAQNSNKCPHGMPAGTCPICSGMGGGVPKDKNKPRKPGEMSYNECMAVWIRMQNAEKAKMQAKIKSIKASNLAEFTKKIESQKAFLQSKLDNYFKKLDNIIQKLPPVIKIIVVPAIKIIQSVLNIVVNVSFNVVLFIASVSEKMAMLLYEAKNHIVSFIQKTIEKSKKILKTILSLFMEFEDDSDNSDKQKIEEIVKNAVKKILKKEKEKEDAHELV